MQTSNEIAVIILAAGKGTRMRSRKAKVLHEIAGEPMILYPVRLARDIGARKIVVVVGHLGGEVRKRLEGEEGDPRSLADPPQERHLLPCGPHARMPLPHLRTNNT